MRLSTSLAIAIVGVACKYDLDHAPADGPMGDGGDPRGCRVSQATVCQVAEAEQKADFAWLQQNMFSTNCSGDDCHGAPVGGNPPAGRLSFAAGFAYKSLLGKEQTDVMPAPLVKSDFDAQHNLVEPLMPAKSYLLFMLRNYKPTDDTPAFAEPPSDVGYMPQSNSTLCCQKLDAVQRWIAAGALP